MIFVEKKRVLFFGLPFTFTTYKLTEEVITINSGLFKTVENDCYMYKVQDVTLSRTLLERMFGLGTITCQTSDVTHPTLTLVHIKNSHTIKDYLLSQTEAERRKRRTLNTLDIGVDAEDI
ncbi:PH domain-containing protein [Konateibacter massiliensis]|uniref:PH domain-containing protein n=1 Tax=Konateibacter massiliensis TaxID=2002841 RepID=UPI000C14756A|nr:PH domain-containing protein [Konateibacter massiliensis]